MKTFKVEGCITKNIEDRLRNGLWLEFNNPGVYVLYDKNLEVINELFSAACGVRSPMAGNIVYENTIFWQLSELQRSIFISKEISILTNKEFERLKSKTVFDIFYEEIYFSSLNSHKIKTNIDNFLKELGIQNLAFEVFSNLPEETQYEVIYNKLFYKRPSFIHLWISPSKIQKFDIKKFIDFLKQKSIEEKFFCFFYTNDLTFNLFESIIEISDSKNYYVSGMVYSVYQELNPISHRFKIGIKNFFRTFMFFNKSNLKILLFLAASLLLAMVFNGFANSFDFVSSFKLTLNFNLNSLIQGLGFCFQIIVNLAIIYYFFAKRKQIDNLNFFLITKGCNRMWLLNIYLFWITNLFIVGVLLEVIIFLAIIPLTTDLVLVSVGVIWPILINFLFYSLSLIPHYLHLFNIWGVNFRYIIKDFQK